MPENSADEPHFNLIHRPPEFTGNITDKKSKLMQFIEDVMYYEYKLDWNPCKAPNGHMVDDHLYAELYLFGYAIVKSKFHITYYGPAHNTIRTDFRLFGVNLLNVCKFVSVCPMAPMKNRVMQHMYTQRSFLGLLFGKALFYYVIKMVFNIKL